MSVDRFTVLQEMYDICLRDRKEINNIIQDNINQINDIDVFLQSMQDKIESDFKVFSPRSGESVFKEQIEEKKNEKNDIENENQIQYKKLNQIEKQIENLELLLQEQGAPIRKPLSSNVLELQEMERQRIARELHDTTVQNLAHLVHAIELSSMFIDQDPIRAKLELETCIKNLRTDIEDIRSIIFNLRPMSFDDLGFKECVEQFLNGMRLQYSECEINFNICELALNDIKDEDKEKGTLILLSIYRIIQEAVTNSLKHSEAKHLDIKICRETENCTILIKDDGKGFIETNLSQQENKHFGISIMRERVSLLQGSIIFNSELEVGTEVVIQIACFK